MNLSDFKKSELGGLSGQPLKDISTNLIKKFYKETKGKIKIIGVGGVDSGQSAFEKISAGANAIQLYTGMVYKGPGIVKNIKKELISILQLERRGFDFGGEHEDPQLHRKMLSIQSSLLSHLLSGWTLDRISDSRLYGNTYSTQEMMNDLTSAIFLEEASS